MHGSEIGVTRVRAHGVLLRSPTTQNALNLQHPQRTSIKPCPPCFVGTLRQHAIALHHHAHGELTSRVSGHTRVLSSRKNPQECFHAHRPPRTPTLAQLAALCENTIPTRFYIVHCAHDELAARIRCPQDVPTRDATPQTCDTHRAPPQQLTSPRFAETSTVHTAALSHAHGDKLASRVSAHTDACRLRCKHQSRHARRAART